MTAFWRVLSIVVVFLPASSVAALGPVAPPSHAVNGVLGDQSFVAEFGRLPTTADDEDLRIRTHLRYVERRLRARDVSHWPEARQVARAVNLDRLAAYTAAGAFPRNQELSGRRPCFIDAAGNYCAVGSLVAQSAGAAVAAEINRNYQYALISQIDDPALTRWLADSGLTAREAAMIQPFYTEIVAVASSAGQMLAAPDGSGPTLDSRGLRIDIWLSDQDTHEPIVAYPRQDLWLGNHADSSGMGLAACSGGTIADRDTDAEGHTLFAQRFVAGGWVQDGLYVYMAGVPGDHTIIPITVNSPDITGDREVDLADVGEFAFDFQNGYAFRSDLAVSDPPVLNLADVGVLALHNGTSCP